MNSNTTTENYRGDSTEQTALRRALEKQFRLQYQCHVFSNSNVTREASKILYNNFIICYHNKAKNIKTIKETSLKYIEFKTP